MSPSKMNILVIVPGGVGSGKNHGIPVLLDFVHLMKSKVELHVLSVTSIDPNFKVEGFQLHSLGLGPKARFLDKWRAFRRFMHSGIVRPDLIHPIWTFPHALFAWYASRRWQVPYILNTQGGCMVSMPALGFGANQGFLKRKIAARLCRDAAAIVCETKFQRRYIPPRWQSKAEVIYYGIPKRLHRQVKESTMGKTRIIHVGNITPIKDQKTLLHAFALLRSQIDCELVILGGEYDGGALRQRVHDLGVAADVRFLGAMTRAAVMNEMAAADLMMHSSIFEGSCLAVMEAWAVGLPVVSTRVGIMSDFENGHCLCADIGDEKGLAEAAIVMLTEDERRLQIVGAAADWSKSHTMEHYVERVFSLYKMHSR